MVQRIIATPLSAFYFFAPQLWIPISHNISESSSSILSLGLAKRYIAKVCEGPREHSTLPGSPCSGNLSTRPSRSVEILAHAGVNTFPVFDATFITAGRNYQGTYRGIVKSREQPSFATWWDRVTDTTIEIQSACSFGRELSSLDLASISRCDTTASPGRRDCTFAEAFMENENDPSFRSCLLK